MPNRYYVIESKLKDKGVHIRSEKTHDVVKTLYAPTYFLLAFTE